jgi:AhpD family alkylhydroperoxidase
LTTPRVSYEDFRSLAPRAYAALVGLGKTSHDAGLDDDLAEIVKIRASQINGCAFCLQLHLNRARALGVAAAKLDLLAVWRDAGLFCEREAAALAWTEALTRLEGEAAQDEAWAKLREHFSEAHAVALTVAIGVINNWNRIAGSLRFAPLVEARR